jgi:hypothetical protein
MGLATSPVCASCQLEEETGLHYVCVCPTLATLRTRIFGKPIMNAWEFTEVSASKILRFAFQSERLESNLWHNSLKYVRGLVIVFFLSLFFYPILFRFFTIFTVHVREHIRPKQKPGCRSSVSIRSGSTLLNPSIQARKCRKLLFTSKHQVQFSWGLSVITEFQIPTINCRKKNQLDLIRTWYWMLSVGHPNVHSSFGCTSDT